MAFATNLAVFAFIIGLFVQQSMGSNAIDPKGNPVPENPTTLPTAAVRSDLSPSTPALTTAASLLSSVAPSQSAVTTTLRSLLLPSASFVAPAVGNNDTHCENTVNDNDNITAALGPSTAAPLPLSSSTTAVPSQPALTTTVNVTSPAPISVGITDATTQKNFNEANKITLGVSSTTPAATTGASQREGRQENFNVHASANSIASASVDLPRGYYLPPKDA